MSSTAGKPFLYTINNVEFETLLEQHELLDATELLAQIGHCRWDYENNRLISCSQGYARIFNMSVEEIIAFQSSWGKSMSQIVAEDRDKYLAAYYAQQETGNYTIEYRITRNDGEIRSLREVGLLKFDDNNNVIDAFGIIQDITDTVAYQQELETSQELARQVEAITDIGHFINDEEIDKYLFISTGFARIHGRTVKEYMQFVESRGDNLAAIHEDDRERLRADIIGYVERADDSFEAEYRVVHPDGKIAWVRERSKSRIKANGRVKLTLGVCQDITEKKNYEQSLKDAKDSLEETVTERTQQLADTVRQLQQEVAERGVVSSELESKNAELERFAYTVSHDLKTPLVTIKGFLGLLDKDLAAQDMDRAATDMAKITRAADTMARLLEELLELSRIGHVVGDPVTCRISEIARHAMRMVEARIVEQGIEVEIDDMPAVSGDKTRLIEVYQNLIENAIKFMGEQHSPRIHIGSRQEDGKTCFFVSDNGIGIANEFHELVFELFERLSQDVEGTGVGLTLVKRIIEVHGGKIWVESDGLGQGCTILFTLPGPS
jgi:PAS domain S-box-containing protein